MAQKVIVELEVDESGAVKSVENLNDEIQDVNQSTKEATQSTKGLGAAFKGVGVAVRAVGAALKAVGIGIIIGLVGKLTELLLENQAIADQLSKTFNTISIVFNQLVTPVIKFAQGLDDATGRFDALGKVAKGVLDIVLLPFKEILLIIEGSIISAQLAWEKSFFGGQDIEKIAELQAELIGVGERFLQVGEDAINAGISIVENFGEAVTEVVDITVEATEAVVEGFKNIDLAAAQSGAAAIDAARKRQEFLEIEQQALKERFDREAELQRQIRDDVSRTIEERIAANERLGEILDDQAEQEQENINQRIANIQLQNSLLGETQERNVEIFRLQTELEEVQARVAGFRSEQLTNENSLLQEQEQIQRDRLETSIEIGEIEQQASIDLLESERARITEQIRLEEELYMKRKDLLEQTLQDQREGTQAYQDIQNEIALIDANYRSEKSALDKQLADFDINLEKQVQAAKVDIASAGLVALGSLAEEGTELQKGFAVAQATVDTYKAANAAYAALAGIPVVGPALGATAAGIAVAAGLANVKRILATNPGQTSPGASGSPTPAGPSAPSVAQSISLVAPDNGLNELNNTLDSTFGQPVRAFAVGQDVTNQQQLDRQIVANGQFG